MSSYRRFRLAFTLSAASLLAVATVRAQTVISSLPYTINNSGTYVLNSDLNSSQTSGNLILINASNVTLDFQNHYIAGPVGNTGQTTTGVLANEQANLTVKNGTVAFCNVGIQLGGNGSATTNSVDHVIDNMRVTYCYYVGISVIKSPASRVTNCQVSQTGFSGASSAAGISGVGGVTVQGNTVSSVTSTGPTSSYGLFLGPGDFARQNTISNAAIGVQGGKYQDNLTSGCTTAVSGGTDAGGNS